MIDAPRDVHLAIIRKHYPGIALQEMTQDAGGEHYIYVVDTSVVFRFPQLPRTISAARRNAIEWLVATGAVPFSLPTCGIHHDREFDLWFERTRYLPGVPFMPEVAATFSEMGAFLSALHGLPLDPARERGMDEMDPSDFWDYMESNPNAYPRVRRTLWPLLPLEERTWIEVLFERFIAQARQAPLPLVIHHNDMFPYHIIVDPATRRISGVIDFSWRIADPAGDFKAFEYYGPAFIDEVYAHYHHLVDPGFDSRRLFYTGHDEIFGLVRALDTGDRGRINHRRESLSTYIHEHPDAV